METKPTIVLGASPNPDRYAHRAVMKLQQAGHPVFPVGKKKGQVNGIDIINSKDLLDNIHTITLYLNPQNQQNCYDYILETKPKRIVFNPGTENPELEEMAQKQGIETEEACTLVLLTIGKY